MGTKQNSSPLGEAGRGATRGMRNNNPLNIRRVAGTHWKGEVHTPSPLRGTSPNFLDSLEPRRDCSRGRGEESGVQSSPSKLEGVARSDGGVCQEGAKEHTPSPLRGTPPSFLDSLEPRRDCSRGRGGESGFCKFTSIEYGLRAAFVLLRTYSIKYHANCIKDIITRWAPPTENDTRRYIRNVCLWTGLGGLQRLTEQDWPKLVRAMARQECGEVLDENLIQRGFELYKTNL